VRALVNESLVVVLVREDCVCKHEMHFDQQAIRAAMEMLSRDGGIFDLFQLCRDHGPRLLGREHQNSLIKQSLPSLRNININDHGSSSTEKDE
jgi:hypothetical protein